MSWRVSEEPHQDLFILNGENCSAYFFRRNETFFLYLEQEVNHTILQYNTSDDRVTFSWPDFTINNTTMSDEDLSYYGLLKINSMTFINPEPDNPCSETYSVVQPSYNISSHINYGYVVLICVVTVLGNKIFGTTFIKTLISKLNISTVNEEEYVVMS